MADIQLLAPSVTDRPAFSWRSRLDGVIYGFRMVWNSRLRFWTLTMRSSAGDTLFEGIRVSTGVDMIRPLVAESRPPGQLFVVDDSGRGREPGRFDWRADFRMLYRPLADVEAAAGTADEIH